MPNNQTIIIGAGAAGLMCAISAAENGKSVLVLDHANKAGKKILISGGGRCNFTNMDVDDSNYLSQNPHFCKSALKRYTQWDFIAEVDKAGLPWHEKKLGQLFSDNKSEAILNMLLDRCEALSVSIVLNCSVNTIVKNDDTTFSLKTSQGDFDSESLVIATGAMSFPTMGATDFGHNVAKQFGLEITATQPGLVPFTFDGFEKNRFDGLSGVSMDCVIECKDQSFRENILFTHKGLSGPAVLQISSYWQPGNTITVNCLPDLDLGQHLKDQQQKSPNKHLIKVLKNYFPERTIKAFCDPIDTSLPLQNYKHNELEDLANLFQKWHFIPSGTEGYKKAEVTLGGVNTDEISSKTFESKKVKGLYFIGEVLDVTGHLGGFNFQWAWASGHCCGKSIP
jgi:predicted Rossmann fold flavoprotein